MTSISTIPVQILKAALMFAPKADVRYYLRGVCVDPSRRIVVATDGHTLLAARYPGADTDAADGAAFIVPRETVELGIKSLDRKTALAETEIEHDSRTRALRVGRVAGEAIDGTFPDYDKVLPKHPSGKVTQFNADYLARAQDALMLIAGSKTPGVHIAHNGDAPAILTRDDCGTAFVIVMPCRVGDTDPLGIMRAVMVGKAAKSAA